MNSAYGAKGDGTTDDAAAIQAAIDAAEADTYGGVVFFPPGLYRIASSLSLIGSDLTLDGKHKGRVSLVGSGRTSSILQAHASLGAGAEMLAIGSNSFATRTKEFEISNLQFNGNAQDVDLIAAKWVTRGVFRDLLFLDTSGHGLHATGIQDFQFYHTFFQKCGGDGTHYATLVEKGANDTNFCNNLYFFGCRWEVTKTQPGSGLLKFDGTSMSTRFARNRFVSCKWHGTTPAANRNSDNALVQLLEVKETDFFGSHMSQTSTSCVLITDSQNIQFLGGVSNGQSVPDRLVDVVNGDNISFVSHQFANSLVEHVRADSNSSNIYLNGCYHNVPNGENRVSDTSNRILQTRPQNNRLETHGVSIAPVLVFSASDTTPSVVGGNLFQTHASTQTLTDFDDGTAGQEITVISKAAVTYDTTTAQDASHNLDGSSVDIVTATGDTTTWVCEDGTRWILKGYVDISVDNSAGA